MVCGLYGVDCSAKEVVYALLDDKSSEWGCIMRSGLAFVTHTS